MGFRTIANSVRRFIAVTLLVTVGLVGVPLDASAFTPSGGVFVADGITYKVLTTPTPTQPGTAQVGDGVNFMNNFSGHLAIPAVVSDGTDEYQVTDIGPYAFASSGLTSIDIPEGVTSIGAGAFRYCSFTSVQLPSTLRVIGGGPPYGGAFDGCHLLSSVSLPDGLEVIGERAFYQCYALTNVDIPDAVSVIGPGAFASCTALSSLTIGSGVREIAGQYDYYSLGAFEGCTGLTQVHIPDGVTSIGAAAFQGCAHLTDLTLGRGVEAIGGGVFVGFGGGLFDYAGAFQGCSRLTGVALPSGLRVVGIAAFQDCGALQTVSVPTTLETIDDNAFLGCQALTSINLPEGLNRIGNSAFYFCLSLEQLTLPATVTSVDARSFFRTSGLRSIDVDPNNLTYSSVDGVLFDKNKTTLLHFPAARTGTYVVPDGVTSVGEVAFAASRLTGIVLPGGLQEIGVQSFDGAALTQIRIPGSVVSIRSQAFMYCTSLRSLDLGPGVQVIEAMAFSYCYALQSAVLPLSLERLGAAAFNDCRVLATLQLNSPTTVVELPLYYSDSRTIPSSTKIRGYDPSTAKDYATQWGNPFELIGFDPVAEIAGTCVANRPIVVLVAGLASNTGEHLVGPPYNEFSATTGADYAGDPWAYLGALTADEVFSLGFEDVLVMPTAPDYQHADSAVFADNPCIDSLGPLDFNIRQLAAWLEANETIANHPGNPIVLVGHSYGGVIARSMLVSNTNAVSPEIRRRITGIVQFGSPNGGSYSADCASDPLFLPSYPVLTNYLFFHRSDATKSLSVDAMRDWNDRHLNPVRVPVVRFAGTYMPDVVDQMPSNLNRFVAQVMSDLHGGVGNDACTALLSIESGYGTLDDGYEGLIDHERDFGGGEITAIATLSHAGGLPGVDQTYDGITYRQLVPQDARGKLLPGLATAVTSITSSRSDSGPVPLQSLTAFGVSAATSALPSILPDRTVAVPVGETTEIQVVLDAPTTILLSSASGEPTIAVRDSGGTPLDLAVAADSTDGVITALARIESPVPGPFTLTVGLEGGVAGDVAFAGVASGGATLSVREESDSYVGTPVVITAEFESSAGVALTGAAVTGSADCDGVEAIDVAFRDDGAGSDVTADDGVYTASVEFPMAGTWTLGVDALHPSAERSAVLITNVGSRIASVSGTVVESPVWSGELLASYGIDIPVSAVEDGTYAVSAPVTDSLGARIGTLTSSGVPMAASETATLTASVGSPVLAGAAPGPLTVGPIRITRYTDGVDLLVGSAPGFITATSYSADDFYDFSISLSGPSANPSPTGAVHFTGTAHNTPSTVASVEYSIDGSTTWQPIEALDGAFDSSHEDFEIDLDLPDYVYGIYVRQTGADGVQLPVGDWAGIRFTVDTVAPTQPADLAAVVTSDTGSPVAQVSWLPSDPPSDVTSLVGYRVSLDGIEVGMTCGTDFDVPLPDEWRHTITVTPIDLAGNIGAASEFVLGTTETDPPTTTLTILPTAPDGEDGWYVTAPEVSLSTDEPATTYFAWDGAPAAPVAGAITAPEGTHQLSFYSVDTAENQEATQTAVVRVDLTPPSAPVGLQATPQGLDQINLQWNAAVDAHSGTATYLVYRADGSLVGETTGTSYAVTGLEASTQYSFYVVARDAAGHTSGASDVASDTTDATQPPVLAPIGNKTVSELMELAFTVVASDADSDVLAYSLVGAPQGASIHSSTGAFTWTPTEAQGPGTYPMMVVVSDGTASDFETITITVEEVNIAPLLAPIGDKAVNEGSMLTFRASASDADSNPLTFSLVGAPPGAFISESTGVFIWTPTEAQGPGTYTFTVGVTDGVATDTETITVTVAEVPDVPTEVAVTPVEGAGRVETAIAASQLGFATSEYVVIATARSFPDALGGSALAGALDAPILLTEPTTLSAAVKAEIARLEASHVIVLGGTGAVSADVFDALDALPGVTAIERIFGDNRYATAEEIAERTIDEMGAAWDGTAFAATGESFPDALGASPVAAAKGWPIYLVHPDPATYAALIAKMRADGVTDTLVLGGNGAVYSTFTMQLGSLFEERLEGLNRYTTAIEVAKYGVYTAGLSWDRVALATGQDFPDALSGGALQGASGSVMLLVHPDYLYSEIAFMLTVHKEDITEVRFLGGTGAVPQVVRDEVVQALQ